MSPALCALLFKPHEPTPAKQNIFARPVRAFFKGFNRGFEWISFNYGRLTGRLVRVSLLMLIVYGGLIGLTVYQFVKAPDRTSSQAQDQGYLASISIRLRRAWLARGRRMAS